MRKCCGLNPALYAQHNKAEGKASLAVMRERSSGSRFDTKTEENTMNIRTTLIASTLITVGLISGTAQAALQGRDLDGNLTTAEAYYDTVLNATWLADANYAKTSGYDADGLMNWNSANAWAAQLNINGYDNWRLPTVNPVNGISYTSSYDNSGADGSTDTGYNISAPGSVYPGSTASEMAFMYFNNLGNIAAYEVGAGAAQGGRSTDCGSIWYSGGTCLDNVGPFINLMSSVYHTSSEFSPGSSFSWQFVMESGYQNAWSKTYSNYAWAVSSGDVGVAVVPEADTWAMLLAGLGLVGVATRRRRG
jgi:hypothetical protein